MPNPRIRKTLPGDKSIKITSTFIEKPDKATLALQKHNNTYKKKNR